MRRPSGYWMDINNIKKELEPLILKYGRFPSNNEMTNDLGSSLPRYIHKYHGGIIKLSKELGESTYDKSIGRREKNTWKRELVIEEFLRIIKEKKVNYYPSRNELYTWGVDIYVGITQTFGTYKEFKKTLNVKGVNLNKKVNINLKWTEESIKQKLIPIVSELGYFPSQNELNELGLSTIRRILSQNQELQNKIIEELVTNKKFKIRKWTKESVLKEINGMYKKYGRILGVKEMMELGYGSLYSHLNKLSNETLINFGYFDTSQFLLSKDGHKLRSSYELFFDNFLFYNNIIHTTEGLIPNQKSSKYLYDFKIILNNQDVYVEVWGYSRGRTKLEIDYSKKRKLKEDVYNRLNLNLISVEDYIFEKTFEDIYIHFTSLIKIYDPKFSPKEFDVEFLIFGSNYSFNVFVKELEYIVKNNDGFFPTTSDFQKMEGGMSIITKIQKYGGVDVFKNILNVEIKPKDLMWTLEKLKQEIKKFNNLIYIPSYDELVDSNRIDLFGGIQRNGGYRKVSQKLSIPTKQEFNKTQIKVYNGKLSESKILLELKSIIDEIGIFPSEKYLKQINRVDLYVGIKRIGGIKKIKMEFGFEVTEKIKIKIGDIFDKLKVTEIFTEKRKKRCICICECGKKYNTSLDNLKNRVEKKTNYLTCGNCNSIKNRE